MLNILGRIVIQGLSLFMGLSCLFWVTPTLAAPVNLLNSTISTASGSGASGVPSITNFNIPPRKNRVLFIWTGAERDHCSSTDNCTGSNTAGTGLSDNWPFALSNFQLTARVTGNGGTVDRKNAVSMTGTPQGDLMYHALAHYPKVLNYTKSFYSLSSLPMALFETDIAQVLGGAHSGAVNIVQPDTLLPMSDGDDAILLAMVFENVEQTPAGIVRNGALSGLPNQPADPNYLLGNTTITLGSFDSGQVPDEAGDALVLIGFSGSTEGFLTPSGYNRILYGTTTNNAGIFDASSPANFDTNEANGISLDAFFRQGTTSN